MLAISSCKAFSLALEEKLGMLAFDELAFAFAIMFDPKRLPKFRLRLLIFFF